MCKDGQGKIHDWFVCTGGGREGGGLHQAFQEALLYCVCVPVVFDQYGRAREAALPRLTEVGAQLEQQRKVAKYSR